MHNLLHYCKIAHEYMTFDTHTNLIMLTIQTPKLRNSIVSIIKNFHNKRQNRKFCSIAEFLLFFSVQQYWTLHVLNADQKVVSGYWIYFRKPDIMTIQPSLTSINSCYQEIFFWEEKSVHMVSPALCIPNSLPVIQVTRIKD